MKVLIAANTLLLILFPLSWFAPLMRAGLLPLFGLNEISLWSGIASLWQSDVLLALVVIIFAIIAPISKTLGLLLIQLRIMAPTALPLIGALGKFAMADVFLIALYIVLGKVRALGGLNRLGDYIFSRLQSSPHCASPLQPRAACGTNETQGLTKDVTWPNQPAFAVHHAPPSRPNGRGNVIAVASGTRLKKKRLCPPDLPPNPLACVVAKP